MSRTRLAVAAAALAVAATPLHAQDRVWRSAYHDFRVVTVAEGLQGPWSIAFLPDGDMLVTEKAGQLRIIRDGRLLPDPVPGVPDVVSAGQGGLLDVVPHPDFASNRLIYLSFSKPKSDRERGTTAIIRARFENDRLSDVEEIFEADTEGRGHYGSRIAFDGNGYMYFSVGDRQAPPVGDVAELEAHPAQDRSNHHGTINRLHDDGRVPDDNPFVGQSGMEPSIWSYGHRNPQGLAFDPATGALWATEHGPQGGDELNRIERGLNYGWPVIGYGVNYRSGSAIHIGTHREGMEAPEHFWVPSIGTSGLAFYTGDRFPEWRGNALAGGLSGQQLARLTMDEDGVVAEETLVLGLGRIRDVRNGPDGLIYLAIDPEDDETTRIVRLEPVEGM